MLKVKRCRTIGLRLDPQKRHGIQAENFCPQVIDRAHYISSNNLLGRTRWVEPIERGLSRFEVMQVDPPAAFSVDPFDLRSSAPPARLLYFRICIAGIDSPRNI